MARTVPDLALAMSVLAGPDPRVPLGCPVGAAAFAAFAVASQRETADLPLAGIRVAVTDDFGLAVPVEPQILAVLHAQITVLESLGAVVETACPDLTEADRLFDTTRALDMATSLGEVVAANRDVVKAEVVWNVERGLALTAADLIAAAEGRTRLHHAMTDFFGRYDVLLAPSTQVLPFPSQQRWPRTVAGVPMETYVDWMRSLSLISATGCPAVSVPAGFTGTGLPVGVQLVAADSADLTLLRVAHHYTQATRHAERAPVLSHR